MSLTLIARDPFTLSRHNIQKRSCVESSTFAHVAGFPAKIRKVDQPVCAGLMLCTLPDHVQTVMSQSFSVQSSCLSDFVPSTSHHRKAAHGCDNSHVSVSATRECEFLYASKCPDNVQTAKLVMLEVDMLGCCFTLWCFCYNIS